MNLLSYTDHVNSEVEEESTKKLKNGKRKKRKEKKTKGTLIKGSVNLKLIRWGNFEHA